MSGLFNLPLLLPPPNRKELIVAILAHAVEEILVCMVLAYFLTWDFPGFSSEAEYFDLFDPYVILF